MNGYYLRWGVTILLIFSIILLPFTTEKAFAVLFFIALLLAIIRVLMSIFSAQKYLFEEEYCKYRSFVAEWGLASTGAAQSAYKMNMHQRYALIAISFIIACSLVVFILAMTIDWSILFSNLSRWISGLAAKFPLFAL